MRIRERNRAAVAAMKKKNSRAGVPAPVRREITWPR